MRLSGEFHRVVISIYTAPVHNRSNHVAIDQLLLFLLSLVVTEGPWLSLKSSAVQLHRGKTFKVPLRR